MITENGIGNLAYEVGRIELCTGSKKQDDKLNISWWVQANSVQAHRNGMVNLTLVVGMRELHTDPLKQRGPNDAILFL